METLTFYQLLSVSESATSADIKAAFYKKAKTYHPDKGGSKEAFQLINAAYHTLSDPIQRAEYDHDLALKSQSFQPTNQSEYEDDEIPETSPSLFTIILKFLASLGFYVLAYWGLISLGKWLNLETLAYCVYFYSVYYMFFKSLK